MHRHLPEPAPLARLRRTLAALPSGFPTSTASVLAAVALIVPVVTFQALPDDGGGPASHRPPDRNRVATTGDLPGPNAGQGDPPASGEAEAAATAAPSIPCLEPDRCRATARSTKPGADPDPQAGGASPGPVPTAASQPPDPDQHSGGDDTSDDDGWQSSAHPSETPEPTPSPGPEDDPTPSDGADEP